LTSLTTLLAIIKY